MVGDLARAVVGYVAHRNVVGGERGPVELVVADTHADHHFQIGEEGDVGGAHPHFEDEDAVRPLAKGFGDVGPGFGVRGACRPEHALVVFEVVVLRSVWFEQVLFEGVILVGM